MISIDDDINTINLNNIEKEKKLNKLLLLIKEEKEIENKKLDKEKYNLNQQNEKIEQLKSKLLEIKEKRKQERLKYENELRDIKMKNFNIQSQISSILSVSNDQRNDIFIKDRIEYYQNKQNELQSKLNQLKDSKEEDQLKSSFLKISTNEKKLSDKIATFN